LLLVDFLISVRYGNALTYLLTYIIVVITDDHDVGDLILCDLSSVGMQLHWW